MYVYELQWMRVSSNVESMQVLILSLSYEAWLRNVWNT